MILFARFAFRLGSWLFIASLVGCGDGSGKKLDPAPNAKSTKAAPSALKGTGLGTQITISDGEPATRQSPQRAVAEDKKPTVFPALELAKVLDLRKLGTPAGAKITLVNSANLDAKAPGKVPEVAAFYLDKLKALGWQIAQRPGVAYAIKDDYAEVTVEKDGHSAFMSIADSGNKKDLMVKYPFLML